MATNQYQAIIGCVLLVAVVVAVSALAWHGVLTGNDAYGLFSAIVGLAGGAFAVHAGVTAGAKAANTIPTKQGETTDG